MQLTDRPDDSADGLPRRTGISAKLFAAWSKGSRFPWLRAIFRPTQIGSDSDAAEWVDTLGKVVDDLSLLNHNTEQYFLEIGGKLAEFIQTVKLISSELAVLSELESGAHAAQSLTRALDYSRELQERDAKHTGLGGMSEEAARMRQTLSGFNGTVSTFHILGMLTRIETARLGSTGADVGSLADQVQSLTEDVDARVSVTLDLANSLVSKIERAMQVISATTEEQAEDSVSAVAGAMAGITSLREVQDAALASSVRLGSRFDAISGSFKKLIVSLQFHDITRQQVEHVIEVLRRLRVEYEEQSGGVPANRHRAAATLALQSLQLADAGKKFSISVASVQRSLDDIAANVLQLAAESGNLTGVSEDRKASFFLQIEKGCAAVLGSLDNYSKARNITRTASGGVAETFDRMTAAIVEIQALEIQMHRLAVNAIISAAHIGEPGDALGVLAGSIQQRASESNQRSESLLESLRSMTEEVGSSLKQSGLTEAGEPDTLNESIEDMQTAVTKLQSSSERGFALISQIVVRGTRLGEDVSAGRASFSIGEVFAEAVVGARELLKDVEEKTRSGLSNEAGAGLDLELADLAKNYTMQSQRDVHESLQGRLAPSKSVASPIVAPLVEIEIAGTEDEEGGDNIEFF